MNWIRITFVSVAGWLFLGGMSSAQTGYIVDTQSGEVLEHTNNTKLWYAHGTWWAILQDDSIDDWFIYRKDGPTPSVAGEQGGWSKTATNVDVRNSTRIDLFHVPSTDVVHVLRMLGSDVIYKEYVWSAADERYVQDSDLGDVPLPGAPDDGCIAVDSTGQAFVSWEAGGVVSLAYSTNARRSSWSTITLATGTPTDLDNRPALVPVLDPSNGPQMGLLYFSGSQRLTFRTHDDDGDSPADWLSETVDTNTTADDHACLRSHSVTGDVFAVVKTRDDEIVFFKRLPGGPWGDRTIIDVSTATRAQLVVDETNDDVYVFWTDLAPFWRIVYRQSAIDPISFGDTIEAMGEPGDDLNDVQLPKASVDCETALPAVAEGLARTWYNLLDLDSNAPLWYRDADEDGFGDAANSRSACLRPDGFVDNADDCDDTDGLVYPGAPEVCDGKNNDCNDPNWPTVSPDETDDDSDGTSECAGDCDDANGNVYAGAPQTCDGVNNDCDDPGWPVVPTDETDDDGDGTAECEGDCDDTDAAVYPGAPQVCDGANNDCNDPLWPTLPAEETDDDSDGTSECSGDCDDTDPSVYPGAPQACDGVHNDCSSPDWPTVPADESDDDSDGLSECSGDCDDANAMVYPGAVQLCDGINNDCSDPNWPMVPANETDDDSDGTSECRGDCDDTDASVYPGASQLCDGINNDCADPSWPAVPVDETDDDSDGTAECDGDCDDTDASVYPGASQLCDGVNNDCSDPNWPVV
ncbi:MAG: putative metal-binding motif-containing protein, partial [Acidobacteriota bacterium]